MVCLLLYGVCSCRFVGLKLLVKFEWVSKRGESRGFLGERVGEGGEWGRGEKEEGRE